MHRNDGAGALITIQAANAPGAVQGFFNNAVPGAGQTPTTVDPDFLTMLQEELIAVAAAAGITPVKGTYNQLLAAIRQLGRFSFDEATPPGSPISLQPGNRLTITFTGVASIPLHVASAPGIYKATLILTANNTTDSNWLLKPNDTTYSGAFSAWGITGSDSNVTSLGSATAGVGTTSITASPFVGNVPIAGVELGLNSFFSDMFSGPVPSSDILNDIGPSIAEFVISTFTTAKMVKQSSGITGGPAVNFSKWNDTTTPWISLGTLTDLGATSLTGTIVIERLA